MEEVKLYTSTNEMDMIQACELLKEAQIPYIRRDSGSGGYMNIYM